MCGTVNVLIGAYNGEKYIEEQINSILQQTYKNIKIIIRDDGSTDGTVKLIEANPLYNDIVIYKDSNVGHGKSFLKLLEYTPEGDYWAFCDQDDVWEPQKLEWAVEWLDKQKGKPALYHGSYDMYSEDLSVKIGEYKPTRKIKFHNTITDSVYQGFSIVINRELRSLLRRCDIERLAAHDWMAGMIAEQFGTVFFDTRITARHRRLKNSLSAMNLPKRVAWFIKALQSKTEISTTVKEFLRVFGDETSISDRKILEWFNHDRYNIVDALKKACYYKRWRPSILSEIAVRVLMVLGKV